MKLTFSPIRMDVQLSAEVKGDVLVLNGLPFDFSRVQPGTALPLGEIDSPWINGDVQRTQDGTLIVPLLLPHGAGAPIETLFPVPVDVDDGPVPFAPYGPSSHHATGGPVK